MQPKPLLLKLLDLLSLLLLVAATYLVFFYAPMEAVMGNVQKVFYFHVSTAWVGMLGFIAAGAPLEPYTDPDATFPVAASMLTGKKSAYVLKVKGDSMIEEGIFDGDYVVVEHQDHANQGDIIIALLENGFATMKKYFLEENRIKLMPANAKMLPIYVNSVRIQGKVVGLIRQFN